MRGVLARGSRHYSLQMLVRFAPADCARWDASTYPWLVARERLESSLKGIGKYDRLKGRLNFLRRVLRLRAATLLLGAHCCSEILEWCQ
jgi:hypothetical protein